MTYYRLRERSEVVSYSILVSVGNYAEFQSALCKLVWVILDY
jgi:hypothetical protein